MISHTEDKEMAYYIPVRYRVNEWINVWWMKEIIDCLEK